MRFTREGGVFGRPGTELKATLGTGLKVNSLRGMENDAFQVMFCKSGTKIYQSADGENWYDIGVTRTASETDFFFPFRKDMFVVNRTDGFLRIAVSILRSQITAASSAVPVRVGDGETFTNGAAVVYVEGDEVNYTAVSSDDLTTASNIGATHAAGSIVTQTTAVSANPKGSCLAELEGSALIGGVSANPATVHYSEASTPANPEYFYDFPVNYKKIMPSDVTCLQSGNKLVLVGMKRGLQYADGYEELSGALRTNKTSVVHGVPNAFCVAQMDEDFVVLTDEGRILPAAQTDAGFQIVQDPNNPKNDMDFPVSKYIRDNKDPDSSLNFVHYDPVRREVVATILLRSGLTAEFILQRDIGAWSVDTGKNFSCRTTFKGRVYAGSDSADNIYLENEGNTDAGLPIRSRVVTGQFTTPGATTDWLGLKYAGLLSATGVFTQRIHVTGPGGTETSEEMITADDLVSQKLMSTSSGIPIGSGLIGAETFGSGGAAPQGYAFKYPWEFLSVGEKCQLEWEWFDEGTQLEIRHFSLAAETESELDYDAQ